MANRSRLLFVVVAVLLCAIAACSEDSSPTDGGTLDTTPPGITAVTPVDLFHIDVTFTEKVTKLSAEDTGNYALIDPDKVAMSIAGITLNGNGRTASITTDSSMAGIVVEMTVDHVRDPDGNRIGAPIKRIFTGSVASDETAPQIVSRSPAAGAVNVPLGTTVVLQFSEAVSQAVVVAAASWTSQTGPVPFSVQQLGTVFALVPNAPLANNSLQTITLPGVRDISGNTLTDTEWSFTTTSALDNTPPTLVSTLPVNLTASVNGDTNLWLTFSEPVNPVEFDVTIVPDPGAGVVTWLNRSATFKFNPENSLLANTQYAVTIYPGGVRDLAGNGFVDVLTVKFTTGEKLARGSIAGLISGDPGSEAADPTGATVLAATGSAFSGGRFDIAGSAVLAGNNTYILNRLPDDVYYPLAIFDTNDDGTLDLGAGDAIGAYGIASFLDTTPDSVTIIGGNSATEVNFGLLDPTAVLGTVVYSGIHAAGSWTVYVGLFDTVGFTPTAVPVAATTADWPGSLEWAFNNFDESFPDAEYYVGAYLDVNDNGTYEPATDPAGMYGGTNTPTPLNVSNGSDFFNIVVAMTDPVPGMARVAVAWPSPKSNPMFERICEIARRGLTAK